MNVSYLYLQNIQKDKLKLLIMDFFQLIKEGDLETIKSIVKQDEGILHQKDGRGFPPLVMASYSGNLDVAKYLIEAGVDINAIDAAGNTALMGVCFKGYLDIVKLLLKKGAEVNIRNWQGASALIYAVTFGKNEIAKELIKAGADKSFHDDKGNSAITYAKSQGNTELVALLG